MKRSDKEILDGINAVVLAVKEDEKKKEQENIAVVQEVLEGIDAVVVAVEEYEKKKEQENIAIVREVVEQIAKDTNKLKNLMEIIKSLHESNTP